MDVVDNVVSAVAEKEGVSECELPMLYDSIDPEALKELFEHATTRTDTELLVQFSYAGYTVTVQGPNDVTIDEELLCTE